MNTLENNNLLAEFMGYKFRENMPKQPNGYQKDSEVGTGKYLTIGETIEIARAKLTYHTDWNHLMPVIAKVNSIVKGKPVTQDMPMVGRELQTAMLENDVLTAHRCISDMIKYLNKTL